MCASLQGSMSWSTTGSWLGVKWSYFTEQVKSAPEFRSQSSCSPIFPGVVIFLPGFAHHLPGNIFWEARSGSWPGGGELLLKNSLFWLAKNPLGMGNGVVPGWALSFPNYLASSHSGPWHLPFGKSVHPSPMSNFVPDHVMSCRAGLARHPAQDQPWGAVELRLNHTMDFLLPFKNNVCSWCGFTMILNGFEKDCSHGRPVWTVSKGGVAFFFLIVVGWQCIKEPTVFLAECG